MSLVHGCSEPTNVHVLEWRDYLSQGGSWWHTASQPSVRIPWLRMKLDHLRRLEWASNLQTTANVNIATVVFCDVHTLLIMSAWAAETALLSVMNSKLLVISIILSQFTSSSYVYTSQATVAWFRLHCDTVTVWNYPSSQCFHLNYANASKASGDISFLFPADKHTPIV